MRADDRAASENQGISVFRGGTLAALASEITEVGRGCRVKGGLARPGSSDTFMVTINIGRSCMTRS